MHGAALAARDLARELEDGIARTGLLFRVFHRAKHPISLSAKLARSPGRYEVGGRCIQDVIGIRIGLYFADDVDPVVELVRSMYGQGEAVQDSPEVNVFGPTRLNIVFPLPTRLVPGILHDYGPDCPIDSTFELQIRTMLSEGWHEVEHDLRYKHVEDWSHSPSLDRSLNGVYATLETCDWAMITILDQLAHRHYRSGRWAAMVRSKFRLRFQGPSLSATLVELLSGDPELAKAVFRADRALLVRDLSRLALPLPISEDLTLFVLASTQIRFQELEKAMPPLVRNCIQVAINRGDGHFDLRGR